MKIEIIPPESLKRVDTQVSHFTGAIYTPKPFSWFVKGFFILLVLVNGTAFILNAIEGYLR